ncbi:4-oxalocrotonate tautomerase family enzyme [Mucilaginibacter sp. OAE612]
MPYVKIELTREGVTREQKQILIKGVTDLINRYPEQRPAFNPCSDQRN